MNDLNFASETVAEPTTAGWYRYSGGSNSTIFLQDRVGQWYAIFDNGQSEPCQWGYIQQALSVWDLELMVAIDG